MDTYGIDIPTASVGAPTPAWVRSARGRMPSRPVGRRRAQPASAQRHTLCRMCGRYAASARPDELIEA
ncbi:MAG: hypothetical protein HOP99_03275, partial [Dermatophilaceae bacterium]|nr:hypothetical protein [Dermatophilaceae bacterium]